MSKKDKFKSSVLSNANVVVLALNVPGCWGHIFATWQNALGFAQPKPIVFSVFAPIWWEKSWVRFLTGCSIWFSQNYPKKQRKGQWLARFPVTLEEAACIKGLLQFFVFLSDWFLCSLLLWFCGDGEFCWNYTGVFADLKKCRATVLIFGGSREICNREHTEFEIAPRRHRLSLVLWPFHTKTCCDVRWPMRLLFYKGDRSTQKNDWDWFPTRVLLLTRVGFEALVWKYTRQPVLWNANKVLKSFGPPSVWPTL